MRWLICCWIKGTRLLSILNLCLWQLQLSHLGDVEVKKFYALSFLFIRLADCALTIRVKCIPS